jgi:Xaa-Pro dipeptidase
VLKANRGVIEALKPGINWQDLHILAEDVMLAELQQLNFFRADASFEELKAKRLIYYFFPHGLGHYIGTYVHDLKGDPLFEGQKKEIKKQRIRFYRVLEPGMCVTVEPGLYFIRRLLDQGYKDEEVSGYFNKGVIEEYMKEVQAVRIEDMVHVKESGAEILTANLPRTTSEIEEVMGKKH